MASNSEAKGDQSFSRPTLPYVIAALVASAAMAWYFFVYVPAKLDYFIGLRFRTLAVASGHISSKLENLATAFHGVVQASDSSTCTGGNDTRDTETYLSLVLPDIRIDGRGRPAAVGPTIEGCGIKGSIAWNDVVELAAASSQRDFDDLILATGNGDVVWQRETSTTRIGNLSELLGARDESEGWGFSWREKATSPVKKDPKNLQSTAQLKSVNLGGNPSILLVQALTQHGGGMTLPGQAADGSEPSLYLAGLVIRDGLQRQARRIPAAWLVPVGCAIVFLFLSIPFVKLATLTAKERFRFADVLLMVVATVAAAGFGALLPFVSASPSAPDKTLGDLATKIQKHLAEETSKVLTLGSFIREQSGTITLEECATPVGDAGTKKPLDCRLWHALGRDPIAPALKKLTGETTTLEVNPAQPPVDLDVVIWVDEAGNQIRKWTTKKQVTGRTSHVGFEHFDALRTGHLWTVDRTVAGFAAPATRFAVEPLRAPTTSELAVAFAMGADDDGTKAPYLVLNVRPQSLVDSLVPPGYGFAIVAPGGKVLFHSEEGLSLEENFFEELGDARDARENVATKRVLKWSGDYHGRRHRFRMEPFNVFAGSPWSLVTFEETEARLASEVAQQSGAFRLGVLNLVLLALLAGGFAVYSKLKGRRARDLMQMILTDPQQERRRVGWLFSILAVEVTMLIVTFTDVPLRLNLLYFVFVLSPLGALLVAFLGRRWNENNRPSNLPLEPAANASAGAVEKSKSTERFAAWLWRTVPPEIGLLVFVIGALPAIAFSQIAGRVQRDNESERWLALAQDRWVARQVRLDERLHSPNYAADTRTLLEAGFATRSFAPATASYSYLLALDGIAEGTAPPPPSGQRFVRRVLEWDPFSSADEPIAWQTLTAQEAVGPRATVTLRGGHAGGMSGALVLIGVFSLAAALFGVYWARHKLLAHGAPAPSLDHAVQGVGDARDAVVLLIGPPMSYKDKALRDALERIGRPPVDRVRLLHTKLSSDVVDMLLARVDRAVQRCVQAGKEAPFWVHVSNLETQLVDPDCRRLVFELLQRLGEAPPDQRRVVAVTSSVDPIAHFEEIFREERARIYTDPVPEVALSRSALILSRVRRCYMPISPAEQRETRCRQAWDRWWGFKPTEWEKTLDAELNGIKSLEPVHRELKTLWRGRTEVPFEEIVRTIRLSAAAFYHLLWTTCTRSEKLVLIQLAQEGFVVEQSWDVVAPLIAKGIIVQRPIPALFNRTFRDFLLDIERDDVIQEWERGDGRGLWLVSGRLIGSTFVAGLIFFLLTQDVSVQSLLPVVSGTGVFSVPIVRTLIARFSKAGAAAA